MQTTPDKTLQALTSSSWRDRWSAASSLQAGADPALLDPLTTGCRDEHWLVRQAALPALAGLDRRHAAPMAATLLRDPVLAVRLAALQALEQIGAPESAAPDLLLAADDPYDEVREPAAKLLDQVLAQAGVDRYRLLVPALEDENGRLRRAAVELLAKIGDSRALQAITTTLEDKDDTVRAMAVGVLGKKGGAESVGPLLRLLPKADSDFRTAIFQALDRLAGRLGSHPLDKLENVLPLLESAQGDVRKKAVELLAKIGDSRALQAITTVLEDKDDTVPCGFSVPGPAAGTLGPRGPA